MIVLDSSIFIDDLRSARHSSRIAAIGDLIRTSSVVLAELWRGATTLAEERFLVWLENHYPLLTPTEKDWLDSGRILKRMQRDYGFDAKKLRDLHFDLLIALTVRTHGAKLITTNRDDFELIRKYRDFKLEIW
jgi:predicted nucleic acid-binding protein